MQVMDTDCLGEYKAKCFPSSQGFWSEISTQNMFEIESAHFTVKLQLSFQMPILIV